MTDPQAAEMNVRKRRSPWRNLSLVWLVPLGALGVTLYVAWQSVAGRGSLIHIRFENAAGVVADETTIRYRDVVIGSVEDVNFTDDLSSVLVDARIDRTVSDSLPEDAEFWVVRPEVSTSGISGLSTVLSGVYIEAAFEPKVGANHSEFEGLNETPLVRPGMKGTRIILRANDGTMLTAGAPIFHQGIEVGRIETPRFLDSGEGVIVDAFIEAPNDRRITTATRFWDTSGFSVNFGPGGLNLSVGSVAALIRGGLAFDTVFSGGRPVSEGYIFDLFDNEAAARDSVFSDTLDNAVELTVEFNESVRGLEVGSPVTYQGLRVGQVSTLGAFIEDGADGQLVKLRATISIDPRSLGLEADTPTAETIAFFAEAVQNGLRARLATQSIFNRSLVVELVDFPDAAPETLGIFDRDAPLLPSVDSDIPDVAATAEGLLNRVNNLPVEELLDQAIATMAAVESLAADQGLRDAPAAFTGLLNDARGVIGSEAVQQLPAELTSTVQELRGVVEDLRTADAAGQLVSALKAAEDAATEVTAVAGDVSGYMDGVPELLEELRALTAKANTLPLEELVANASSLLNDADAILDTDAARLLPERLTATIDAAGGALAELQTIARQLQEQKAVETLVSALTAAESAATEVSSVATSVDEATAELPQLIDDLRALTDKANSLEVEDFLTSAREFLDGLDRLVDTPEFRALPASVTAALDEVREVMAELRAGGVVDNTNATLASARSAASAIEEAAATLPQLSARIQRMVGEAEVVLNSYGDRSDFNRETVSALREVKAAAEALTKLARAIERNPNSLLFGR
ncbi:MlaD family protein [Salipiger sp.]|uniref:MlaD family protein n=1 Tax=Salipiger sp. TaxID=2078585 RepID=UPI003A971150